VRAGAKLEQAGFGYEVSPLLVGVGAAFDLLSGNLSEAPDWMKQAGLQWMYRLMKEPKRLWRRYLLNNPRFTWLTLLQLTGLRGF